MINTHTTTTEQTKKFYLSAEAPPLSQALLHAVHNRQDIQEGEQPNFMTKNKEIKFSYAQIAIAELGRYVLDQGSTQQGLEDFSKFAYTITAAPNMRKKHAADIQELAQGIYNNRLLNATL
jgi:hypothetical protein